MMCTGDGNSISATSLPEEIGYIYIKKSSTGVLGV